MTFPFDGSYFGFRLDPVASLQDIKDEVSAEAARRMAPKVYVACKSEGIGDPQRPPAYELVYISLVQQGLSPSRPEDFCEPRISMFQDDDDRRECLHNCAEKGATPPPASASKMTMAAIELANAELSEVPSWKIMATDEAERLRADAPACGSPRADVDDITNV
ncbi:hypothetical protein EV122DRAFT_273308 [Schizophyllum commune]